MTIRSRFIASCLLPSCLGVVLAACGGGDHNPLVPAGATVSLQAGDAQSLAVAARTGSPLAVIVKDAMGSPIAGIPITWAVVSGGGTVTPDGATGSDGIATATYTAGTTSGPKVIAAGVDGAQGSPVQFTLTVTPGPARRILKASGDLQQAGPSTPLQLPLKVQVVDSFGNGVAGTVVSFNVQSGGGSVFPTTQTTDANGSASTALTTGPTPATNVVTASATGLTGSPVSFTATTNNGVTLVKTLPYATTFVHDQFVRGGVLFVCAWQKLDIYDVGGGGLGGTPANPIPMSPSIITNTNGVSGGAQMHNVWWYWPPNNGAKKYIFVGQEGPGTIGSSSAGDIHVVDISNLGSPVEVAYYHMSGLGAPRDSAGTHNFWVDETNQVLYAAYYNGGVVAIDVSGTLSGNLATREIARIRPAGAGNLNYTWGVQLYNGSVYATDMLTGFWQLKLTGTTFSVAGGGNNVPERFGSDQWVSNGFAYSGTWGTRAGVPGNAVKIWQLSATGSPGSAPVDSIITPGIGTVSDVEVSADGKMLMFSAEGGPGQGIYFYSLVTSRSHPTFIAYYPSPAGGIHTATFADIGAKRYVFAARDPGGVAELILDVTAISP